MNKAENGQNVRNWRKTTILVIVFTLKFFNNDNKIFSGWTFPSIRKGNNMQIDTLVEATGFLPFPQE